MKSLDDFLALPDVDNITEVVFVSKRIGTVKVKAMTTEEFTNYQKKARGKIKKDGIDFDSTKFNLSIVAGQTIEPDFNNAELLRKANCATAIDFITKKLLPGEISELATKIQEISGFDVNLTEDIEEAKN